MSKNKPRRLWLNIKAKKITVSQREFVLALLESIKDGTYILPKGWEVTLEWRNREDAPMKSGPWTDEMRQSAESSEGWDRAVTDWLDRKFSRLGAVEVRPPLTRELLKPRTLEEPKKKKRHKRRKKK